MIYNNPAFIRWLFAFYAWLALACPGDGICSSSRGETLNTCPRDCKQSKFSAITPGQADTCTGNNGNGNGSGSCNGNGNGKAVGKSRRALLRAEHST